MSAFEEGIRPRLFDPAGRTAPRKFPFRLDPNPASWFGWLNKAVAGVALGALLVTGCAYHPGLMGPLPIPDPVKQYDITTSIIGAPLPDGPEVSSLESAGGLAGRLVPRRLALDPLGVLERVESGRAVLSVPLRPGRHALGGQAVRVRPETRLEVALEVREGRIVPTNDGSTFLRFDPPIAGPVWTRAGGVYVKSERPGRGQLVIDVHGWLDAAIGKEHGLSLAELFAQLGDSEGLPGGKLLEVSQARFRVEDARFSSGPADLGPLKLQIAEGSTLEIEGTVRSAALEGALRIEGGTLRRPETDDEPELDVVLGAGTLNVRAASRTRPDGQLEVELRAEGLDAQVDRLRSARAEEHLIVENARIRGVFEARALGPKATQVGFSGHVDGAVPSARLRAGSDHEPAEVRFSAERLSGQVLVGKAVEVDAQLSEGHLAVRDLDVGGRLGLDHALFEGDVQVTKRAGAPLRASVQARRVEMSLTDYRSGDGRVDLGRTEVSGSGRAWIDGSGVRVEGELEVEGVIDDLRAGLRGLGGSGSQRAFFDVGPGSSLSGRLRRLELPSRGAPALEGRLQLAMELDFAAVAVPGLWLEGRGRLEGQAKVRMKDGQLELSEGTPCLELVLGDGRLGAGSGLSLDFARGSRAHLRLGEARLGRRGPIVALRPGSRLDVRLDEGRIEVAGRSVRLESGTFATFAIDALKATPAGLPELVGRLELEAPLEVGGGPEAAPDIRGPSGVAIQIERARLGADGHFRFDGVEMHLAAQTGLIEGVRAGSVDHRVRLEALLGARPELRSSQDLLNHFYRVGGGTWAGAARAARAYGVELNALTAERAAPVPRAPQGPVRRSRTDRTPFSFGAMRASLADPPSALPELPSLDDVRESSPEALADLRVEQGSLDPWAIAARMTRGAMRLAVPLEGTVGRWPEGVTFAPGTVLVLRAQVLNARLDPDSFSAELSKPGAGPLWTELRGAYLDEEQSLRLAIAGWPDAPVKGLETLPLEMGALVERLKGLSSSLGPSGPSKGQGVLRLNGAQLFLQDAQLAAGSKLTLPFGTLRLASGARIDVTASSEDVTLVGTLDLDAWAISSGPLAAEAASTRVSARVQLASRAEGGFDARLALENLRGQIQSLAFKDGQGGHIALGAGDIEGQVRIHLSENANGDRSVQGEIDLDRFKGEVRSLRFVAAGEPRDDPPRLELGRSQLDARLRIGSTGAPSISGRIHGVQGALRNLTLQTVNGPLWVHDALFEASASVDYGKGRLTARDGRLKGRAVLSAQPEGLALGAGLFRDVRVAGGKATLRFDIEHFDEITYGPDHPLVLQDLRGQLGGVGRADRVEGRLGLSRPRPSPRLASRSAREWVRR